MASYFFRGVVVAKFVRARDVGGFRHLGRR
jgi:hypothetical protein